MQIIIPVFLGLFFVVLLPTIVYADVFIPTSEYTEYFDYEGVYTVVGNVKNQNNFALIPIITISVIDDDKTKIVHTFRHVPIPAMTDIPFKQKFPEIHGKNPVLLDAELQYVKTEKNPIPIQIIYDKTLITYDDGHVTGRIKNIGNQTVYNPKVFAIVHGYEKYTLDVTQNIEPLKKIKPGQILNFTMYPDPSISEPVRFYSCFAPVDTTVIPVTAKKDGGDFNFRYDSGAWYSAAKFDEDGTTMSMRGYNSYPLETYANFEFPPISGNEKFSVTLNDEPVKFIQSVDEMGFWHVAFRVGPISQGVLKISGFEKGLPHDLPRVPAWVKLNADWWSTNQIPDSEFLEGIDYLFEKGIISVTSRDITAESQWHIPQWVKVSSGWWYEEKITDDEFLNMITNLVERKIIVV